MPALSSSNRSQLGYKLEGTYPTNFGVLQGGNGTYLNMTGESLDFAVKTEMSKQIRSDRQTSDVIQVGASSQGGFNFEMQYLEYDPFIEGVFQSTFTAYGTNGTSAAYTGTLTCTSTTITNSVAPTAGDAWTTLQKGQWFTITPPAGASQAVKDYLIARAFRVSNTVAPTSTVITLDAATPINTTIISSPIAVGATITTSRMVNGTTMKSYSLEVGHADITQFRQYFGMIPSKMDLSFSSGQIVTGSFDFLGKNLSLSGTTGLGTPTASQTYTPVNAVRGFFDILEGGTSITATTFIKSGSITIDNTLRAQEAVAVFGNAGIAAGTLKISGKLEVYFADATMYNKLLNNTDSSLQIPLLDPAGNGYVLSLPRIKYMAAKVNASGLDQDNMLSMDFMAIIDTTATSGTLGSTAAIYRV